MKRAKRKIPRNAVEPLMKTCEMLSKEWKRPAKQIFKEFLGLMDKYADYFFSQPWPKKYDYEKATTFTDEDMDFLLENAEEFHERFRTVSLKKNISLEGFMGYFGMFWTQQAFHNQFVRPEYEPVLEAFKGFAQSDKDARSVLNKLKENFSINSIHDSLADLLEQEYPDKPTKRLIEEIFELLHTEEGLPSCGEIRCSWYWRQKYPSTTSYG